MKLEIARREGDERGYRIHRVWIVIECRPYIRKPQRSIRISGLWRRLAAARQFAGTVSRAMIRMLAAAGVTYIYAVWDIEQAYLKRGYQAYGGEYLVIPFVFYAAFKVFGWIAALCCGAVRRIRNMEKEHSAGCRSAQRG